MKKIFFAIAFISVITSVQAQDQDQKDETKGFKKENLFTGGGIGLGFGTGYTDIGINPYFGYSLNKWLDVAAVLNFNYNSQRNYPENYPYVDDKLRETNYGGGAFIRAFPVNFLFAQVQYEHNFDKVKYSLTSDNITYRSKAKVDVNNLFIGAGYASGRSSDNKAFYYISVMFDVIGSYVYPDTDGYGKIFYTVKYGRIQPTLKAGINIPLFQGRRRNY